MAQRRSGKPANSAITPTRAVADRVRSLRQGRGWSQARLAEEMTAAGVPWDRPIVANLELGRRAVVSVGELFALAHVLAVAPVHLLVPVDDDAPMAIVPDVVYPARRVREFVRGRDRLDVDEQSYYGNVPRTELTIALLTQLRSRGELTRFEGEVLDRTEALWSELTRHGLVEGPIPNDGLQLANAAQAAKRKGEAALRKGDGDGERR